MDLSEETIDHAVVISELWEAHHREVKEFRELCKYINDVYNYVPGRAK